MAYARGLARAGVWHTSYAAPGVLAPWIMHEPWAFIVEA